MEASLLVAFTALGGVVGFLAGLLGIGGGLTLVPMLTALFTHERFPVDHLVHMAVATATATMIFTSISSAREHHRHGAVRWPAVLAMAPGIVVGAAAGPQVVRGFSTAAFAAFFGVFVAFMATQILLDRKPHASRQLPGKGTLFAVALGIGLLSAMVGAGGAFLTVPFMIWCNVPPRNAVATAAALGLPIAVAGTLGFIFAGWHEEGLPPHTIGYIYIPALVAIALGSVLSAPLGARMAHRWPVATLRRAFAVLLYILAGSMIWKALHV